MNIVVDLGCYPHALPDGRMESSIPELIERFQPDVLYGFDPYPDQLDTDALVGRTRVLLAPLAAWTEDTALEFDPRELGSTVMREKNLHGEWRRPTPTHVSAFDFPAWLRYAIAQHPGHDWIVKMDIEGAEFPLLRALADRGLDQRINLLLVEWHDHVMEAQFRDQKTQLLACLRCPVEDW